MAVEKPRKRELPAEMESTRQGLEKRGAMAMRDKNKKGVRVAFMGGYWNDRNWYEKPGDQLYGWRGPYAILATGQKVPILAKRKEGEK